MHNKLTELTQRLLRGLDSNYNVIDMPEVVESISQLEKVAITIELLKTTRLGKYVNELRRKTSNQELSRRAKDLLKKWRSMLPPVNNGPPTPPPPGPPKLSPPISEPKRASPALQGRMLSPGVVQKLVSPGGGQQILNTRLVSPQIQRRLVSPQTRLVSPGPPRLNSSQIPSSLLQSSINHHHHNQLVSPKLAAQAQTQKVGEVSPPLTAVQDVNLNNQLNRKRPIIGGDILERVNIKRSRMNGGITDLDISDSSNSSFKDIVGSAALVNKQPSLSEDNNKRDVIVINSDSNSSYSTERTAGEHTIIDQIMLPKRRGRKKGSKNHRNLLDEAETSFTNKLAVSASRGSSKVKTTQEILAGIQNKNNSSQLGGLINSKPSKEDLEEKAAKLTERVSIIDRKLNANAHRNKNSQKHKLALSVTKPNERVIESGSVINDKSLLERLKQEEEAEEDDDEDEVVVVDDNESVDDHLDEKHETDDTNILAATQQPIIKSLSEEEALALLPPIDRSVLLLNDEIEFDEQPRCTCYLKENKKPQQNDFSIGDDDDDDDDKDNNEQLPPFELIEDPNCLAKEHLTKKYNVQDTSEEKIQRLHEACLPNVNGNWSAGISKPEPVIKDGFYINIVPHISERLDKDVRPLDSFKKYSVTEGAKSAIDKKAESSEHLGDVNGNGGSDCSSEVLLENVEELKAELNSSSNSEKCDKNRTENIKQEVFREWYECIDTPSFNGETLRILPYCILD